MSSARNHRRRGSDDPGLPSSRFFGRPPVIAFASRVTCRQLGTIVCLLLLLTFAGCGSRQQTARPVDPEEARQTLNAVLADWGHGGKPAAWLQQSPQVVIQDRDWSNGLKLNDFEILGAGESRDANLFCQVKLVLENAAQQQFEQTVTYCVGTDPVLTVFRAMDP